MSIRTICHRCQKAIIFTNRSIRSTLNYIRYRILGTPDGFRLPPPYLIWLVIGTIDAELFIKSGDSQFNKLIMPLLRRNNVEIDKLHAILDFGCGCGRLTRWFYPYTRVEIWGTDYNEKLVRWCQKNLEFAKFSINQRFPPLDFTADKFDFILIRSVFTHLTEKSQKTWLEEFYRITTSNGIILFTVHGDNFLPSLTFEEAIQYRKGNLVVKNENFEGSNKCGTYHPPEYLYRVLPECGFEIIDRIPGGTIEYAHQDTYLARKISE
ncbi:MAG: class I SAM-dependent methyltransferase [Methanotrichaceae archaeon]|nr:class I SAM-dependent methyltransferase [Methanotrichaceae archaeon]